MLTNQKTRGRSIGPVGLTLGGFLAATFLAALHAGLGTAQEKADAPSESNSSVPSRAQLIEKQVDVSLEARDIERILGKLKRASDLSKQRITEAATKAESVSGALDRGDSDAARTDAQVAAEMFKEIAKQLEALLAEETPQRVAAAQNLAQRLSMAERQFMQQFPGALNATSSGKGKSDPRSQVRPQAMKNQGQGGKGKMQGKEQANGQGAAQKKEGDDKGQDEKKEGAAGEKKDMPKDGAKDGKDGDMPPDAGKQNQNGKGAAKEEEGEGAGKKKKDEGPDKQDGNGQGDSKDDSKEGAGGGKNKDMPPNPGTQKGNGQGDEKDDSKDRTGSGKKKKDMPQDEKGAGGGDEQSENGERSEAEVREALARRAQELAESGRTLEDILKAITDSAEPADAEAVRLVQAVLKETNLTQAIANMQQAAVAIRSGDLDEARLASLDIADRMEITSQRLGAAYRQIVAPQAEELRDAEKALAELRERLERLETPSQVAAWHREARELLDKLEKLGISEETREQFTELMKTAIGGGATLEWQLANGFYVAPGDYTRVLLHLQEDIQARLQSLVLGNFDAAPDEATPPKYQELVERYYQVLSRDGGREKSPKMEAAKSDGKKK